MNSHALGNRYEIVDRIGSGGMASVYLARDTFLGRNVAIKILHEAYAADPTFIARFRREAQAAARLNHPNVVTVYDWGEAASDDPTGYGRYFLVMEYVPGPNLKDILQQRGPLPERDALDIAAQVASALDAAHAQGLVHRDVKPHNVLLDPFGRAKVTDFGIAHAAGDVQLTAPDVVSGTAHYLSPEQAQRGPLDGRSDIYSLGVMLYEMLTGRVPFEGDTLVEVAMRHLREAPRPPRLDNPEISPTTEAVVLRALAKDPARRYGSAADMRGALMAARTTQPESPSSEVETTAIGTFSQADLTQEILGRDTARLGNLPSQPRPRVRRSQPSRRAVWMALPLLLLLLAVGGTAAYVMGETGSKHHKTGPVAIAPKPSPTRTTVATHVKPTSPPVPTATSRPQPSPTHPPAATSTPVPATATAAPSTPTSVPATAAPTTEIAALSPKAGDPGATVAQFYSDVAQHRFTAATSLWSPRMQNQWDPSTYINDRFADTRSVEIRSDHVMNQTATQATVAVDILETKSDGPHEWIGSWTLVPAPHRGWLMDSSHF